MEGSAVFRRETGAFETEKVLESHEVNATTVQFQVTKTLESDSQISDTNDSTRIQLVSGDDRIENSGDIISGSRQTSHQLHSEGLHHQ